MTQPTSSGSNLGPTSKKLQDRIKEISNGSKKRIRMRPGLFLLNS